MVETFKRISTIILTVILFSIVDCQKRQWLKAPPSQSIMTKFKYSTIVADAAPCVTIGNHIMLTHHGSIIDGAIATLLCTGVYNMQSLGIGGGSLMVYYERSTGKTFTLDFREVAPLGATKTMFVGKSKWQSQFGGLSIAVPGAIAGYYEAWKRWGKVPWKELFKPTIRLLRDGFKIYPSLSAVIKKKQRLLKLHSSWTLRQFLFNEKKDRWISEGDSKTLENLAKTLEVISQEPFAMYNGSLVKQIVKEIQDARGIITADDLKNYQVKWRSPISIPLQNTNYILHAMEPPSSGVLVGFILNIMSGYSDQTQNITTLNDATNYLHRLVESSKFAFSRRSELGDMSFADMKMDQVLKSILDPSNVEKVRRRIDDTKTFHPSYYGNVFDIPKDHGTSHLSGIDENGNALSVTSSINSNFGSMVMGSETGILYNNQMDDFSTPNRINQYELPPSPSNFIRPSKRPMSSMSPIIVTDASTGDVKLVIGASGGSRIISSVSQVAAYYLFLKKTVKEANDMWRFHQQLYPNHIRVSSDFPKVLEQKLKAKGHKVQKNMPLTAVQVLAVGEDGYIYGNADYRKNGLSTGL